MKDSETFRKINVIEKQIISASLSRISPLFLPILNEIEKFLFIKLSNQRSHIIYPNLYLFSEELHDLFQNLKTHADIISGGTNFGFIKKGEFYISLECAEYFYKKGTLLDFKHIRLSEKGEKSILYGNNITKNMYTTLPINLKKKDFLVVFNDSREIIAIAQSLVDTTNIQNLRPKDIVAINLCDKGYYLRRNQ